MSSSSTQVNAYGAPLSRGSILGTTTVQTNPYTGEFLPGPGPAPAPTPSPDSGGGTVDLRAILDEQRRLAEERAAERYRQIEAALDRARGIRDEARGIIDKRRGQFMDNFNQGNEDILQQFQQRMGEGQTAMEGMQNRNRAALQAMGLSGSALLRAQGRETQAAAKALAQGQDERGENRRENKRVLDENNMWADQQWAAADRAYGDAEEWGRQNRSATADMVAQSDLEQRSNMAGWLQSLLDRQSALDLSRLSGLKSGAESYQATPFAASLGDITGFLQSQLSGGTAGGGTARGGDTVQNVSIDPSLNRIDPELLIRRVGGSMYR